MEHVRRLACWAAACVIASACRSHASPPAAPTAPPPTPGPAPGAAATAGGTIDRRDPTLWRWEAPTPSGARLEAAVEVAGHVLAVGERGALLALPVAALDAPAAAVAIVDSDLRALARDRDGVLVVGAGGTVLRSDDGATFARVPAPTTDDLVAVAVRGDDVWLAATTGGLWRSTDRGATFAAVPGPTTSPSALVVDGAGTLFVGGADGLWEQRRDAAGWTQVGDAPVAALAVGPDGVTWGVAAATLHRPPTQICNACVGEHVSATALLRRGADGAWALRGLGAPRRMYGHPSDLARTPLTAGFLVDGARGWVPVTAVTAAPSPVVPHGGAPWTLGLGPGDLELADDAQLAFTSAGDVVAHAFGASFVLAPRTGEVRPVAGAVEVLAATSAGVVGVPAAAPPARLDVASARWLDVGTSVPATEGAPPELRAVAIAADGTTLAVGRGGLIVRRTAAGAWQVARPADRGRADLAAVAIDAGGLAVAAGDGTALGSRDGGARWTPLAAAPHGTWRRIAVDGPRVYLAGDDEWAASADGGEAWTVQSTADVVTAIAIPAPGEVVRARVRAVERSTDGGATWTTVLTTTHELGAVLADGATLIVGGSDGYLAVSHDAGRTWRAQALTAARAGSLTAAAAWRDGADLALLYRDLEAAVVARSRDGGLTWTEERPPLAAIIAGGAGGAGREVLIGWSGQRLARATASAGTASVRAPALLPPAPSPAPAVSVSAAVAGGAGATPWPALRLYPGRSVHITDAALASDGELLVVGCADGRPGFDASAAPPQASWAVHARGAFVARLRAGGADARWIRFGEAPCDPFNGSPPKVALDGSGAIWTTLAGWDGGVAAPPAAPPIALVRWSADGRQGTATPLPGLARIRGLAVDDAGLVVAGTGLADGPARLVAITAAGTIAWQAELGDARDLGGLSLEGAHVWTAAWTRPDCGRMRGNRASVVRLARATGAVAEQREYAYDGVVLDDVRVALGGGARPIVGYRASRCAGAAWPATLPGATAAMMSAIVVDATAARGDWTTLLPSTNHVHLTAFTSAGGLIAAAIDQQAGELSVGGATWRAALHDVAGAVVLDVATGAVVTALPVRGSSRVFAEALVARPGGFSLVGIDDGAGFVATWLRSP